MFFRLNICQHDVLYSAPTWTKPNLLLRNEQTKQTRYTSVWHQQQYTGPSVRYTVFMDASYTVPLALLHSWLLFSTTITAMSSLLYALLCCHYFYCLLAPSFLVLFSKWIRFIVPLPFSVNKTMNGMILFVSGSKTLNIQGNKMYRMFISIIEFY